MPYWGATEMEVDDHGPISVKVCYPQESEPVTIALHLDDIYIVLHDNCLYFADGKISLCKVVEGLRQSLRFGRSENEVLAVLKEYMAHRLVKAMIVQEVTK